MVCPSLFLSKSGGFDIGYQNRRSESIWSFPKTTVFQVVVGIPATA